MHSLEAVVLEEMFKEVDDMAVDESMDNIMDTLIGDDLTVPVDDD